MAPTGLHPTRRLPPIPQVGKNPYAVHHRALRALRVLRDDRIHRPVDQQRPRIRRVPMADEHDLAVCPRLFQRPADAFGPAADVVDACQIIVLPQQRAGLALVAFGVVLAFANAHHLHHRGRWGQVLSLAPRQLFLLSQIRLQRFLIKRWQLSKLK